MSCAGSERGWRRAPTTAAGRRTTTAEMGVLRGHADHAQVRPDRAAAAEVAPEPARDDHVRARHRTAPVAAADHARRGPPARDAHRRARRPRGKLWNEYVAQYHCLGYKTVVGGEMRYAVDARDGARLPMLGFFTNARTLGARDRFIDWSRRRREKNLRLVVDNPRFLVVPWIRIPNLGSHILALVRRQSAAGRDRALQDDPVLMETFVETPPLHRRRLPGLRLDPGRRHAGARPLRHDSRDKPKKDIWLRPLREDWKRTLSRR